MNINNQCVFTQIHNYTNTHLRKYTITQLHKNKKEKTLINQEIVVCKYTNTQLCKYTITQIHKNFKERSETDGETKIHNESNFRYHVIAR